MNAFKLMMNKRHLDQRIKVGLAIVVDEVLQCCHGVGNHTSILRRHKGNVASALVSQLRSGDLAEAVAAPFEQTIHVNERVVADQPIGGAEPLEAKLEGIPIQRHLLGRRRPGTIREQVGLEKLVLGGDNVFNLRRDLRLL